MVFLQRSQINKTKEEAEKVRKKKLYEEYEPSNAAYKKAIEYILKLSSNKEVFKVVVEKRSNVEKLRILPNQ